MAASGTVLLIVGTSSAGKTSVCRHLQEILDTHHLRVNLDMFFAMVAPPWGGARAGPLSFEGFRYDAALRADGEPPLVTIKYGPVGKRVLEGMHRAVASLAQSGNNVIVDDMLLDDWVLEDWAVSLGDIRTYLIRLYAPLADLKVREHARNNRPGLAYGHLSANTPEHTDFELCTGGVPSELCATKIRDWLQSGPEPRALASTRETLRQKT